MIQLHSVAGDGVLSRQGDLILLCSAGTDDPAAIDEVLVAHQQVAMGGGDGAALADRLGQVASGRGLSLVAFAPSAGSLVVTVFGQGWAIVTTEYGEQRLTPRQTPPEGLRSALPGAVLAIRAGVGEVDTDAPVQRWSDLTLGTIRAGGLLLAVADALPANAAPVMDVPAAGNAPAAVVEPVPVEPVPVEQVPVEQVPVEQVPVEPVSEPEPAELAEVSTEPSVAEIPAPVVQMPPPVAEPAPVVEPPPPPPPPVVEPPPPPPPVVEPPPSLDVAPSQAAGPPELRPIAAPDLAVDRSQPFSAVSLLGSAAPPVEDDRAPLPIATRPAEPDILDAPMPAHPVADDHVEVIGVYCKNGHFDDPSARYCAICGISMAQQTLIPRRGPRPPLGVLVLDDGSIFSLDTDYVIGRDPSRDPDVVSGAARPLRIEDPEGLLSRVHARIHLDGWEVAVIDLGSANGTGVWGPRDSAWQRAPSQTPVVVKPGTQVGVGRRQMRYESHRNT